ncbi:alkaline phosphatase [Pontibacillus halophilus JSM 076056 = DSM 19796]|uniref:Alkaline phosphatase n=1 Tax=Pontibacillus halophilus JSM 076056 = DSM 19796 TaxID=1385510 RepID=A0A0A5GQF5_9BACI|nr:VTT domain-containing protein [Pontibacillus halophilus]KGX93405.1 alkaline phosphatase [Pontibacillus halophilus JSM 076056 = DSM 19796]
MEHLSTILLTAIEGSGYFAPLLFIALHLMRPVFFLPVAFICVTGGVLFGAVEGSILSVIGVTLSSLTFYPLSGLMPKTVNRLVSLKKKLLGKYTQLSIGQVAILRLVPFIHFHLLSLCIIETSATFKDYAKSSFISSLPLAIIYTSIGGWLSLLSPPVMVALLLSLLPLFYLLRRKEIVIQWNEFFHTELK